MQILEKFFIFISSLFTYIWDEMSLWYRSGPKRFIFVQFEFAPGDDWYGNKKSFTQGKTPRRVALKKVTFHNAEDFKHHMETLLWQERVLELPLCPLDLDQWNFHDFPNKCIIFDYKNERNDWLEKTESIQIHQHIDAHFDCYFRSAKPAINTAQ